MSPTTRDKKKLPVSLAAEQIGLMLKMDENLALALFVFLPCLAGWALLCFARHRRKKKTQAKWPQLVAGNLLVFAFLVSILLLGGEVYFRFYYDTTDSMSYTKASQRWFKRYWHENPMLVRDDMNYSLSLTVGKRRISFVGDSFTAGHGIKQVDDRFVNIIRREHPEWEIHLLAQLGLDTGDELGLLNKGLKHGYQLDQVVLVYCLNDISDMIPAWIEAGTRFRANLEKTGWLRRNSYFINTVCSRWQANHNSYLKSYYGFIVESYRGELWQKQQMRLKLFRDLVQARGGRLSVVTFPFLHALGPRYEYRFVHEELDQFWREMKVPHLDLLPVYQDLPAEKLTVSRYDAHPNEYAHALAAAAIDQFLKQQLTTNSVRN